MAEARLAVQPLPAVNLDKVIDPKTHHFQAAASNDGLTVFVPHPRYWIRGLVRLVRRTHTKMQQAFNPLPLPLIFGTEIGALAWLMSSPSSSWIRNSTLAHMLWNFDRKITNFFVEEHKIGTEVRVAYLTASFSLGVLLLLTFLHRGILRLLLSYVGWMEEGRKGTSLKTKIWAFLLKFLYVRRSNVATQSFQTSLPTLPLPTLQDTVSRYLSSMESICDKSDFAELKTKANTFLQGEGRKLQNYLWFKRLTATNYVNDWWLNVVYLRSRDSLMINSNYYALGLDVFHHTNNQAARASYMVEALTKLKLEIDHEKLYPQMLQGFVPLCMAQYNSLYSTTREPHPEMDKLTKYDSDKSRHVAVMCRGRFYKLKVFCDKTSKPLHRVQLESAIRGILQDAAPGKEDPPEAHLGALTAIKRSTWAEIRTDHMLRNRANRAALRTIESSMFVLVLETSPVPYKDLTASARMGLHGRGYDRWYDKSFQMIVTADGNALMNGEHSWGDAPALGHIWELTLAREICLQQDGLLYDANTGMIKATAEQAANLGKPALPVYHAERLTFDITPDLNEALKTAVTDVQLAISKVQLCAGTFRKFGKGKIKKLQCSPDGFIQMAIQLAYYRDQKKFTQTYESGMTRLYRDGRTETIRSAGKESVAFVLAMESPESNDAERLKLLQEACEAHVVRSRLAMTGRGVDRHLFALYVVAVGTTTESPFLASAMGRGWKLSTSQIPQNQCPEEWERVRDGADKWPRPAGGFGPVADDGYGICYSICGEDMFYFHISAYLGKDTNSARMFQNVEQALVDLGNLLGAKAAK